MSALSQHQIQTLTAQGCRSDDWTVVSLDPGCDLSRFRNVEFRGIVAVGPNTGTAVVDGVTLPCGIYDAVVVDCTIGKDVRISHVGSVVANYEIGVGTVIQDVAALVADAGSTCGVGTEVEAVNEAGGRVVRLLPSLSSQIAYLQALRRQDPAMQEKLTALLQQEVAASARPKGFLGRHVALLHTGILRNVNVGDHATVRGASLLDQVTILSCAEHPTFVGDAVQAKYAVIAEGASITGGAILEKVFVGQAVKMGKQYSAENSLFFANCEGFHGEAVGLFAGPYTVTHHKSTLLIAGVFSFYNAGSGTNQSNHMYKLGPVHQGLFERGSKTGSFSYVLHETHVGAFSVVIGKHYTNINTPDLPFSYIHEVDGQSEIVPGMNLFSVGTVRDGEKWPKRDGRKAPVKRDILTFEVFTPYTVEKMRRGRAILLKFQETTPKEKSGVLFGGVTIRRLLLRKCAKYYAQAITRYLYGKVLDRIETAAAGGGSWATIQESLKDTGSLGRPDAWTDIGGLLLPVERLTAIEKDITAGKIASVQNLHERFSAAAAHWAMDEWSYICSAFTQEFGVAPSAMNAEQARSCLAAYAEATAGLHAMILDDSKKEYDAFARIGFGIDMSEDERGRDFAAVRGSAETNSVVKKLVQEKNAMDKRKALLEATLAGY